MILIGIAGKARSGKDTIAEYMVNEYGAHRYALADPLKEAISVATGIPLDDFYNEEKKEIENPFWGLSPRYFAQHFGTECMRHQFREDFWLKRAELEYVRVLQECHPAFFVIPDIRFENEVDWIREMGGEMWHVIRPALGEGIVRPHASEKGVERREDDTVFVNEEGKIDGLYRAVDNAVSHLKSKI